MRAPWSGRDAAVAGWSASCPHGSRPTIEACAACELACPAAADLGVERPADGDALEELRSRLSVLVRPA